MLDLDFQTQTIDSSTRETLENSLAMQVIKLLALIAKADTVVTEEETTYVKRFLESKYPHNIVRFLYERFDDYLTKNLDVKETVSEINKRLSYQEKLFALIKTYELIVADEALEVEVNTAHSIANALDLKTQDVLFIESIFGLKKESAYIHDCTICRLCVSSDVSGADIYLPFPGLNLEIYRIKDIFCVMQKDDVHTVIVGDYTLSKRITVRIPHNSDMLIDNYLIKYHDLHLYFENKAHPLKTEQYLDYSRSEFCLQLSQTVNSIIKITVDGSLTTISPLTDDNDISLNDEPVTQQMYVNFNDTLVVNGNRINLREIVHHLRSITVFQLDPKAESYTISNSGDIQIYDDTGDKWESTITKKNGKLLLNKNNCPYPMYLNNKLVKDTIRINHGDSLYIDSLYIQNVFLSFDLDTYVVTKTIFKFKKFIARAIEYIFHNGVQALDSISFDINIGDLVCIMGPSGSGKSTLLCILSGMSRSTNGEILLDQHDLHANFDIIKDYLGFVPQDDLLVPNLTVYENLYYYARLRMPHKSKEELDDHIKVVLHDIGLSDKTNSLVGSPTNKYLSGGERKRLNIGLELLTDAEVYILDEPTSGLSSKDSEKIIALLTNIANRGKIVIVVIHQPGSKLYKKFSKVILLDKGGQLAFFGDTYDALRYFKHHMNDYSSPSSDLVECPHCKSVQPALMLDSLEESLRDIDGTTLKERKFSPLYWKTKYLEHRKKVSEISIKVPRTEMLPPPRILTFYERLKQFSALFARNLKNKMRDRSNLIITFLEAPLLGFATGYVLRYTPYDEYTLYENAILRTFLFTAVIVVIFLGLTNSVDEIINDTPLFLRERMLNFKNWSYLASKLLVLIPFSVIQVTLFIFLGFMCIGIRELYLLLYYIVFLSVTAFAGISIGLLISAIPKLTSKAAHNIVPLILVPQIILGGALVQYERLNQQLKVFKNDPIPEFCQIMPSRWAYEGLMVLQETFNRYDTEYGRLMDEINAFKLRRSEIIEKFGEGYFNAKRDSMTDEKDKFYGKYHGDYGNADIHQVVNISDYDYRQRLTDSDYPDDLTKKNILRSSLLSYPMFVRKKFVPFTHREINTVYFNGIVIFLLTVTINLFTLLVLNMRKSISFSQLLVSCAHSRLPFHRSHTK